MTVAILGAVSALGAYWCFRRWWLACRWVLVLLVLEGAVRKWLIPEQQQLVYLIKDLMLGATYAGYLGTRWPVRKVRVPLAIVIPLTICGIFGALEIFNPRSPSLLLGVFGWKAYFWYAPLLWVIPASFRDLRDLERFLRRYCLLAIPMVVLALAQFRAPIDSVLNRYAWGESSGLSSSVATFGSIGAVRVTGTFSYITGFTTFLVIVGVLVLMNLGIRGFRFRGNGGQWAVLCLLPIGVLVSGSRGPLILLGGLFPLFFLFSRRGSGQRAAALMRLAAVTAAAAALVSYVALPALEAFSYRVRSTEEDLVGRALAPLVDPLRVLPEVGLFGYGIGATHQAASALVESMPPGAWLDGLEAEAESTRIMIELGPIGFATHYAYRIALVVFAFAVARRAKFVPSRVIALGSAFFLLAQIVGGVVFNVYAGLYFWFLGGVLLLVRALETEHATRRGMSVSFAREGVPRSSELVA